MKSWLARHLPRFFPEPITPCPICGRDARSHFDIDLINQFVTQFGFTRDGRVLSHGGESVTLKGECWTCDLKMLGAWLGERHGILPRG